MPVFPSKPRYSNTTNKALSFLLEYKLSDLPITTEAIFQIIQDLQCSVRTFSFHANKLSCDVQDICEASGSIDGYSLYDENTGKYKIAYNDTVFPYERIRFTLMHEIGHIYLNHFKDFEQTRLCRGGLNDNDLDILDKEANYFASKVLAPEVILLRIRCEDPNSIRERCAISLKAAEYKATAVERYGNGSNFFSKLEQKVLALFHNFIYQKHCTKCHYYFVSKNAKYCPICGSDSFKWGNGQSSIYDFEEDVKLMIYPGWALTQYGKAIYCPRCQNEEINHDYDICKICGTTIVNKCAGKEVEDWNGNTHVECCETISDGNARYCIKCGARTTFYDQNLLLPWEEEKKQIESAQAQVAATLPPPPPGLIPPTPPQKDWKAGNF
jgi:Zn-dependent peptidase ImmA (M78 family)/RNA polymerase subunit RPABC4/transcription elongation factor Spt4